MTLPNYTIRLAGIGLLVLGLVALQVPAAAQQNAAEAEALRQFNAAKDAGRNTEAARIILEYMEGTVGEDDPTLAALTHSYGNLLRIDGEIPEAIKVLKSARERAINVYGEHGIELYRINMDLAATYVDRDIGVALPRRFFEHALEVLRENGQRQSIIYIQTLAITATSLVQAGALDGGFNADTNGDGFEVLAAQGLSGVVKRYENGYAMLEEYLDEARELSVPLAQEAPYLAAQLSVIEARIRVVDTVFLESVPPNIRGSITGSMARANYQEADEQLSDSIEVLMTDAAANAELLMVASNARLEIAWIGKDLERMSAFCVDDALDMSDRYPRDRLFEIADDGRVMAPRMSFNISRNIFDQLETRILDARLNSKRYANWGPNQREGHKPHYIPVCIDGRLMAALINAPSVTIKELN